MVKIEHQTFVYYHVYLLRDIKFTGYVANLSDTRKFTFVRQKPTLRPDGISDGLYVKG